MILPTNPRSATYAVALWIFQNGPSPTNKVIGALTGKFSARTIAGALNEMKRVNMAFERMPDGALMLKAHVAKFFELETAEAPVVETSVVPSPYRKDWRTGSLSTAPRRPMRAGADDYKTWPSRHIPKKD